MLELDDIQHILLARAPALAARYEFLSFRSPSAGRRWLTGILPTVQSAAEARASMDENNRWVTVGFTWNGLRALGVDEASLDTFPEEFKQGMVARAEILGDTGANHPDHWVGGLASPDLHAIAILFARDRRGARALRSRSIEPSSRVARGWRCSRRSTSTPPRRSTTRTTTSATATGCRSRSSRARATSRRPARAAR